MTWQDLPNKRESAKFWRRFRWRLIRALACGDAIVLNTFQMLPDGWELRVRSLDQYALVSSNHFYIVSVDHPTPPAVPGERVMWCRVP